MRPKRFLPYAKVIFSVSVWGASFIATKVVLREVSPVTVVWLRFGIGVLILGLTNLWRRQLTLPGWKDGLYFGLLGFLGITFHQWLQSTGLVTAQASTTAWIVATTPIFMAVLGWAFLRERLARSQLMGIVLAAIGVIGVVSKGDLASLVVGQFGTAGDVLILISAANWAVFSALTRRGLDRHPATWMLFYVMGFGWLLVTGLLMTGPGLTEVGQLSLYGWLGVAVLGIACSGLAYIFWYDGLQAIPTSQVGAFLYLEPLVAVIVAAMVLSEPILLVSLAAGGMILLGVWLVNLRPG
ncbi:MAG: DMT family transporter [Anaerolineales bacterium]|nr:DMT family transporter [Anaerolineales bacterium]